MTEAIVSIIFVIIVMMLILGLRNIVCRSTNPVVIGIINIFGVIAAIYLAVSILTKHKKGSKD
jgi:threonine/homoserine/homoserine lactone efflux protein